MSYCNIETNLTPERVTRIKTCIAELLDLLTFEYATANAKQKASAKIGPKRYGFAVSACGFAALHPHFLPMNRNLSSFEKLRTDYDILHEIQTEIRVLMEIVDNVVTQIGVNFYETSLSFYKAAKKGHKDGEPGMQIVREELKTQFEGQRKNQKRSKKGQQVSEGNGPELRIAI